MHCCLSILGIVATQGLNSCSSQALEDSSCGLWTYSTACGIFLDQGLNPCLLHWQADSFPLSRQGSPVSFNLILLISPSPHCPLDFPGGSDGKHLPTMRETWVQSLGQEYLLEKEMATHSNILAWRIPWFKGAWRATVHGMTKSWTPLSD